MHISEVISAVEQTAPLAGAAAWDVSGMQVACDHEDIARLAVCLDPVPPSLEAAISAGADMVLSHHPLLLKAKLPSRRDAYYKALSLLFRHDVALYAAHTSLDVSVDGPVSWLAAELGMQNCALLEPTAVIDGRKCGFGCCGDIAECSFQELVSAMGNHISLETASVCGRQPSSVRRVAYCTGSGASLVAEAARLGADVYITGDMKYHAALDAEICVLDVGHHSLEEEMMRRFALLLEGRLKGTEVIFIPSESPFRRVM